MLPTLPFLHSFYTTTPDTLNASYITYVSPHSTNFKALEQTTI